MKIWRPHRKQKPGPKPELPNFVQKDPESVSPYVFRNMTDAERMEYIILKQPIMIVGGEGITSHGRLAQQKEFATKMQKKYQW